MQFWMSYGVNGMQLLAYSVMDGAEGNNRRLKLTFEPVDVVMRAETKKNRQWHNLFLSSGKHAARLSSKQAPSSFESIDIKKYI